MTPRVSSALNRATQGSVRDGVDDRRTPLDLWAPLNARHHFTLDVAASDRNHLCANYFTRETDGLLRSWGEERVWCNPPFSRLEAWVAKAWAEMEQDCRLVVMLLPANRCEQPFWQEWIEPHRDRVLPTGLRLSTRFVRGRTSFAAPGAIEGKDSPPFGCVLLTWERVS